VIGTVVLLGLLYIIGASVLGGGGGADAASSATNTTLNLLLLAATPASGRLRDTFGGLRDRLLGGD
jgi:hypothetical protein